MTSVIFLSEKESPQFPHWLEDNKSFHSIRLDPDDLSNLAGDVQAILNVEAHLDIDRIPPSSPGVLQAILDLAPTLLTQFDLDALLQRIVEEAVNLLPLAEAGSLLMLTKENLVFRGVVGYPETLKEVRLPQEHSFTSDLERGEVVHIGQIAQHDKQLLPKEITTALHDHEQIPRIEDTLLAPLLIDDQLIGYLSVDTFKTDRRFDAADAEALRHLATLATIAVHNARLLDAERKSHRLSETLQHLGTTLTSTLDLDEVINGLLEALLSFIDCDLAYVMLVDGDAITVQHWRATSPDIPGEDIASLRYTLSKTRDLRTAVESRQPVLVRDSQTYAGWVKTPGAEWMRSHLTTPLFHEEDLIGFLNAAHALPDAFDEEDCRVMASLAPLAAVALRNAQLFETESEARKLSEAIQKLGMHLTQTLNEADIIQMVAEQIPQILPFHAFIVSLRKQGDHIVSPYHQGLQAETAQRLTKGVSLHDFPLWEELTETQEGIIIPNTAEDPRWIPLPGLAETSALIVPLRSEGKTLGFLTMTMEQVNFYTSEHRRILQSFADLLVVALNNARHHQEAQHRVVELEMLRKLDIHISTLNDPEAIIEAVVACALNLTDIDGVAFFRYQPSEKVLVPVKSAGTPNDLSLEKIPLGLGATGIAWQRQEPILIPNYQTWEEQLPHLSIIDIHSLLALPVTWHQDPIGVLTVYHAASSHSFSPGDISALQ
ncbi:MAG: GAF domain-containing protein, partial [Anaerolineae bacterium]